MLASCNVLSIDYGASNGRGIVGAFDGSKLTLTEVHRFPNVPVTIFSSIYWDILGLYKELLNSLQSASRLSFKLDSIGIDGWSQDFGILDANGNLLGMPHHYRDPRILGVKERSFEQMSEYDMFALTGKTPNAVNTLFQLIAMKESEPALLEKGNKLLFIPNLLSYFLTGGINCDVTLAAASLLYDPVSRSWIKPLLNDYGLPDLLPDISKPGHTIGYVKEHVTLQTGLPSIPVISVAQHDTISAILSVQAKNRPNSVYICCGTWSVIGTTLETPLIHEGVLNGSFSNEPGYYGDDDTYFLKYITGLWILQECMKEWTADGFVLDYSRLQAEAAAIRSEQAIDVEHEDFSKPGNMSWKIAEYCRKTGQTVPEKPGEIYKCVITGLAMKYAETIAKMQKLTGAGFSEIHMVGGGSRNSLLCKLTARFTGLKVVAGPQEASAVGNVLVQLIALGELDNIKEASQVLANSFNQSEYYNN